MCRVVCRLGSAKMASNNYLASVPKLQGRENYEEWSFAMENFLILEGLSKCIDGTEPDSVQIAKAKAKIVLSLDCSLYVHVKEAKTAKEIWDTLKNLYENQGFTRKISLLRYLISLRLENCSSMADYVNQVIETSQKLGRTGLKLENSLVGSLLLAGLPTQFAPMVMALEHSGIDITTDSVKTKLLDMQLDGGTSSTAGAFAGKFGNQKRQSQNSQNKNDRRNKNKNDIICFKCKQPGHFMAKCPNLNQNKGTDKQTKGAFNVVFFSTNFSNDDWYLDSGASVHLTCRQDWLLNQREPMVKDIVVANNGKIAVQSSGEIDIVTRVGEKSFEMEIKNAQYVPELATNLLSVSELMKKGNSVVFEKENCKIFNSDKVLVAKAFLSDGVYKIDTSKRCLFAGQAVVSGETWHRRLGHINSSYLDKMRDGLVDGIDYDGKLKINLQNCEVCCEGKQARQPFRSSNTRATGLLDVVHTDLAGPMETTSIGGSRYYVEFQDDFSRMSFVYFVKTKAETFEKFKDFQGLVEKQIGRKIKVLRSDNGGEYINAEFENYLRKQGIIHQKSNPYTPEQNGRSERLNRSLVEKARCLLYEAGLEKCFWAEAINTACYLRNRSAVANTPKTPYEMFFGQKPNLSHIRIFGSTVMTHIPKEKRRKWDKKSEKLTLVGFSETTKGYRLYNTKTAQISTSRDVHIYEKERNSDNIDFYVDESSNDNVISETQELYSINENSSSEQSSDELVFSEEELSDKTYVPEDLESVSIPEKVRRSERQRKTKNFDDYVTYFTTVEQENSEENPVLVGEPNSVVEALAGPNRSKWISAMTDEMKSFSENRAWDLVDLPEGQSPVKCKWVFKEKVGSDGCITYRARLVAKGFSQKPGIDFDETFSPVVKHSTLRLLLALSVQLKLNVYHLDVVTAFLNGKLEETVFMEIPDGFDTGVASNKNKVLKLNKAVYGLKQSSRVWYKEVENVLVNLNYKKSDHEPCIFVKREDSFVTIIALYVDDFFIFSNSVQESDSLKQQLAARFKIKDLGQLKKGLGMRVSIDKDGNKIQLDQEHYINHLLERFNMSECKPVGTPMDKNACFDETDTNICRKNLPYQQLLGSLMYLSVLTRPDITFAVNFLSQFNNCYTESHWKSAKRILRYLKGTKSLCLEYKNDNSNLMGFVDSDFANNTCDRRSYTGFVFKLAGGAVSWECKKQTTVALSSTEAEYMAVTEASKEAIHFRNLLSDVLGIFECITLYNDNQSAQKLAMNPICHKRSKHIDIRYHFIREAVSNKLVNLKYLSTNEMPADVLTKALCLPKHVKFRGELGLCKNII